MSLKKLLDVPEFTPENLPVLKEILERMAEEIQNVRYVSSSPTTSTLPMGEIQIEDDDAGTEKVHMRTAKDNIVSIDGHSHTIASCKVTLDGNQSLTGGSEAKLEFDSEDWDTGGDFDATTNYRFTAPRAGKYLICFDVRFTDDIDANDRLRIAIKKNVGATVVAHAQETPATGNACHIGLATIFDLAASDYLDFYVENADRNCTVLASSEYTWVAIHELVT